MLSGQAHVLPACSPIDAQYLAVHAQRAQSHLTCGCLLTVPHKHHARSATDQQPPLSVCTRTTLKSPRRSLTLLDLVTAHKELQPLVVLSADVPPDAAHIHIVLGGGVQRGGEAVLVPAATDTDAAASTASALGGCINASKRLGCCPFSSAPCAPVGAAPLEILP